MADEEQDNRVHVYQIRRPGCPWMDVGEETFNDPLSMIPKWSDNRQVWRRELIQLNEPELIK